MQETRREPDGPRVRYAADRLLLRLRRQAPAAEVDALLAAQDLVREPGREELTRLGYVVARVVNGRDPVRVLEALARARPPGLRAEPDYELAVLADPVVPAAAPWYVTEAGFDRAWAQVEPGGGVMVAVVDTGVNAALADLRDACEEGYDVVRGRTGAGDDHGHGTYVAGLIAAAWDGEGMDGLCPGARILPVKALDAEGRGLASDVAAGVVWAADHGARVINLSVGCYAAPQVLQEAVAYAVSHGCLVVAASGNDGTDARMYPAAFPDVMAVSSSARDGGLWAGSNRGPYVDLAAPGERIVSLARDGGLVAGSGTSASAAMVSALAGLLRETHPDWAVASLRQALLATARDAGAPGRDDLFGAGIIDAGAALAWEAAPVHDVAVSRAAFDTAGVPSGERPVVNAYLRNAGTFDEERADVELWLDGRLVGTQVDVAARRETRVVFEIDPFPAGATRYELRVRARPCGEDANPGNNEFVLRGRIRGDAERGMQVLLKDRPFVHSWVAYQGYAILPAGPLKTEMAGYLWGGATYDNLFGDGVRWEEDVDDLDDPSWWSEASQSGACVLEGAYEEDDDEYGIDLGPANDSFMNHFWDPDFGYDYGVMKMVWDLWGRHHSSLWRAHLWWNRAREEYLVNGDKAKAYYFLGRIAHLLADMGTPEHVHNDLHPSDDIPDAGDVFMDLDDISNYEEYTKMVFRSYLGSGSPVDLSAQWLNLPSGYVPSDYDAEFCRMCYNLAQITQHFDSSDVEGDDMGYGGGAISVGLLPEAGSANQEFPAIAYVDGRAEPRMDPGTTPTVEWQKWSWGSYSTYKTLLEGPGWRNPHYVDFSRGEGQIGVPSGVWDDMGLLDRFHVSFRYKGEDHTDNITNFDNWPDKDQYAYVPDRLVVNQVNYLFPLSMRYTAALYELFWQRVHPRPVAPAALVASDGTQSDRIVLGWTNVAGEDGYYVWRATTEGGIYSIIATNGADVVSFEHACTGGVTNWYKVTAFNLGGASSASPVDRGHTVVPAPAAPGSVAASNGTYTNQIRVTWADVSGETGYTIHRADIWDGAYVQVGAVAAGVTQYDDPRPAGGVWYYYKVQAFNGTGASAFSTYADGRTAASLAEFPAWIDATDGTYPNGIMITWDAVVGASHYLVRRALSFSGSYGLIHTTPGTETSYFDDLGSSGLTYWYHVIAQFPDGHYSEASVNTNGFSGVALPAVPSGVAATDGTYTNFIRVTWSASAGATSYEVHRAASAGGTYERVGTPTGTSFDQATPSGSAPWYFKVKACNDRGATAFSAADSGYTSSPAPGPPAWVTASDGAFHDAIRVEWAPVTGASGYTVYRATASGGPYYGFVSVGGSTPWYDDPQPASCSPLYYRVVAYVGGQPSAQSVADSGYTSEAPPPAPGAVAASDGLYHDHIAITWNAAAGADGYRVERATASGGPYYPRGETLAGTLAFDDTVPAGQGPLYYRVIAYNEIGDSPPGGPDAGSTNPGPPAPPSGVAASDGAFADHIRITWTPLAGDVGVMVYEARSAAGPFERVSEWLHGEDGSFVRGEPEIKGGALYYYRLVARNDYGDSAPSAADSGWFGEPPATVQPPVFTPAGGMLCTSVVEVAVTCPTPGVTIRFTTNGVAPTVDDPILPPSGFVTVDRPTVLKARAWRDGWVPSDETSAYFATTAGDPHLLVLGDVNGTVLLVTAREGWVVARAQVFKGPVTSVRVLDADGDGEQDIVALPGIGDDEPAVCLDLLLREKWRTTSAFGLATEGRRMTGAAAQAADLDGDGRTEVLLPRWNSVAKQFEMELVAGATGVGKHKLPEGLAACPVLFFDAMSGHYRLACARLEGDRSYAALFDLADRDWVRVGEDPLPLGPCGAAARAIWKSPEYWPALWGGEEGVLWMADGAGGVVWTGACGAAGEITAALAPALSEPGHAALVVEGSFEDGVNVHAIELKEGVPLWNWTDPKAAGFVKILAVGDTGGAPDQEVYLLTGGEEGKEWPPQVQGLQGADGARLWTRAYDYADHFVPEGRILDVAGKGGLELLVAVNHRIERLDPRDGALVARLDGEGIILAFDVVRGFVDTDGDGQQDWVEEAAGTPVEEAGVRFAIEKRDHDHHGTHLEWPGAEGRHYLVLRATDLASGFVVLTNNLPAVVPVTTFDDPAAPPHAVYRIGVHE